MVGAAEAAGAGVYAAVGAGVGVDLVEASGWRGVGVVGAVAAGADAAGGGDAGIGRT